jgi:hypothetical protein
VVYMALVCMKRLYTSSHQSHLITILSPHKVLASAAVRLFKVDYSTNNYVAVANGDMLGCVLMGTVRAFQILVYNGQVKSTIIIIIIVLLIIIIIDIITIINYLYRLYHHLTYLTSFLSVPSLSLICFFIIIISSFTIIVIIAIIIIMIVLIESPSGYCSPVRVFRLFTTGPLFIVLNSSWG